jgi:catechol 2,3-dioxygenase-like lactoylglutathione lyase family enzyme
MTAPRYAVDHVGLTVPDVEQATAFFRDALGATVRVDIVTEPVAGPELETALALPAGAVVRRVRMLDVGGGAGLELFEFTDVEQGAPARIQDIGVQHLAVLVADIDEAVKRAEAAGATMLADPQPIPGPEAGEGNVWAYCRLPWGGLMELLSKPSAPPSS